MMRKLLNILVLVILLSSCEENIPERPNVILVMTDDQGIGDLACHGNPWLKTPNLDEFYAESVHLTDFHVSPVCTPTRSAIITGRYPINNGAWATYKGRDIISPASSPTLPEIFRQNGYRTAQFGKWHLGDNYPARPTDVGFEYSVRHNAGGVGELSDYWGNNYFNDVYLVNNKPEQFEGYCTDVWFAEAMKYISDHADEPFFVYIPTNAPHSPHYVAENYAEPYRELEDKKIFNANFYGMVANIDENFGKLKVFLEEKGLAENTILIFMTDNGSAGGLSNDLKLGYTMGLKGKKGSKYDGGHRVPFFIRWPGAGMDDGGDIGTLTAHVDLLPTLSALCGFEIPEGKVYDGTDLSSLLLGKDRTLKERTVFVHHRQDWRPPMDEDQTCLMKNQWRLVNGKELYDVGADLGQKEDLSGEQPAIVQTLLEENAVFVSEAKSLETYRKFPVSVAGTPHQKVITLTIQHAIGDGNPIWKPEHVAAGYKIEAAGHSVEFAEEGTYRISLCRWPRECPGPVHGIPDQNPKNMFDYQIITPQKAVLKVNEKSFEKSIEGSEEEIGFDITVPAGRAMLETHFVEDGEFFGVYYTYIEKI